MKKRIVTLVVFLLIACMALTGCSSEESKVENTAAPETATVETTTEAPDSEGMYEWTVRGVTLRTKTNIMDYIKDDIWYSQKFAENLGLTNMNDDPSYRRALGFKNDAMFVRFINDLVDDPKGRDYFCYGIWYENTEGFFSHVEFLDLLSEKKICDYRIDYPNSQDSISFEGIVVFTYACERLIDNPLDDPFIEIFGETTDGIHVLQ